VGVAMGRAGTEVAKEAAEIVITDDDFATIVAAVDEGRVVYRNLGKAVLLLLSTGLAEVVDVLGVPVFMHRSEMLVYDALEQSAVMFGLPVERRENGERRRGAPGEAERAPRAGRPSGDGGEARPEALSQTHSKRYSDPSAFETSSQRSSPWPEIRTFQGWQQTSQSWMKEPRTSGSR